MIRKLYVGEEQTIVKLGKERKSQSRGKKVVKKKQTTGPTGKSRTLDINIVRIVNKNLKTVSDITNNLYSVGLKVSQHKMSSDLHLSQGY